MRKKKNQEGQEQEQPKNDRLLIDKFDGVDTVDSSRVFTNCHTFKLSAAMMLKDISPFKNDPMIVSLDHCHFYHTFDSNGNELKSSNSVGGHYHDIELHVIDGKWKATCSYPRSNKTSRELLERDKHTHEIVYLKSSEIKLRKINEQAMQMIAEQQRREG